MEIVKTQENGLMTLAVVGRLDTATAPLLEREFKALPHEVVNTRFDFSKLEYVASAGLRVVLMAQKTISAKGGSLEIAGANPVVRHVFDITGFSSILKFT